jgi:hypothetical protein
LKTKCSGLQTFGELYFSYFQVSLARPSCDTIKGANLYVSGIPRNLTQAEMDSMFSPFGNIVTSRILCDLQTGRVTTVCRWLFYVCIMTVCSLFSLVVAAVVRFHFEWQLTFSNGLSVSLVSREVGVTCCTADVHAAVCVNDVMRLAGVHVWTELLICFVYVVNSLKNDDLPHQ